MLCFFTTLAIGHLPPFDIYCVLIIPALRAIAAAFPFLQNHLAEIRNVTSCASAQAFIPPSAVRFAPVMYEDSGPEGNGSRSEDCRFASSPCSSDVRNWS